VTLESPRLPTFADVLDAQQQLSGIVRRTPLLSHEYLDAAAGGRVFVKAECLQRTGSFKIRGAYNRLSRLTAEQRITGVVAFSSGNHAQGVALAASLVGIQAVIVMPSDAPASKIEATRAFGAEVVLYDRATESREAVAAGIADERGALIVPPFDDPYVIAGQGTVGLELVQQLEELGLRPDVVLAAASGGGLVAGISLALGELAPDARIFAVEPALHDDHAQSLAAGEPVEVRPETSSFCDALLAPRPGDLTFAINRTRLAGALGVSDPEVAEAMAFAFRHLKVVLEPGGAVTLAAILKGRIGLAGGVGVVVASGGNVDPDVYAAAIQTGQ
jgi:threonine dehydratase